MTDASKDYATRIDAVLSDEELIPALKEITGKRWQHPWTRKPIPEDISLSDLKRLRSLQRRLVSEPGSSYFTAEEFRFLTGGKISLGSLNGHVSVGSARKSYADLPEIERMQLQAAPLG